MKEHTLCKLSSRINGKHKRVLPDDVFNLHRPPPNTHRGTLYTNTVNLMCSTCTSSALTQQHTPGYTIHKHSQPAAPPPSALLTEDDGVDEHTGADDGKHKYTLSRIHWAEGCSDTGESTEAPHHAEPVPIPECSGGASEVKKQQPGFKLKALFILVHPCSQSNFETGWCFQARVKLAPPPPPPRAPPRRSPWPASPPPPPRCRGAG